MTTWSGIETADADAGQRRPMSFAVERWLWLVALLVLAMVVVGGATRLTGSGLSITQWQPIMGAVPPLSDAAWLEAFGRYQQIPQYTQLNRGMSLAEFKGIFWWEWGHRLLGRLVGVAFAVPLAWFWWQGAIGRRLRMQLLGLLALGGLQGAIGWYMVQSGLVERVSVSQYRLALHLGMAILIFGLLVWIALDQRGGQRDTGTGAAVNPGQWRLGLALPALVFAQIILGAFVAGLKAGLTYNTWPLMDGRLLPSGLFSMTPWYLNLFENITLVQFDHRLMAYVVLALAAWHAWGLRMNSAVLLLAAIVAQAALGIWALLAVVPLPLGIAHQAGAVAVLGIAVWHAHRLARRVA